MLLFYLCFVFVLSVHYSLAVTCWERVDLLTFLYVMFYCCGFFFTFSFGVLGQVFCLIVSIPDLCLLLFSFASKISYLIYQISYKIY